MSINEKLQRIRAQKTPPSDINEWGKTLRRNLYLSAAVAVVLYLAAAAVSVWLLRG